MELLPLGRANAARNFLGLGAELRRLLGGLQRLARLRPIRIKTAFSTVRAPAPFAAARGAAMAQR
jgi:hypothetical protein